MSRQAVALLASALLVLGACASATPYQPARDNARGYSEQQIERDRWRVSFSGNSLTDRETVETYLLYRAAELTAQQGYDTFRVVRRKTDEDTRVVATGFHDPFYSGFHCNYAFYGPQGRYYQPYQRFYRAGYRGYYDPFGYGFGPSEYREITRYEANAEISLDRGPKPAGDASVFNAEDVLVNLAGRIQRPEA